MQVKTTPAGHCQRPACAQDTSSERPTPEGGRTLSAWTLPSDLGGGGPIPLGPKLRLGPHILEAPLRPQTRPRSPRPTAPESSRVENARLRCDRHRLSGLVGDEAELRGYSAPSGSLGRRTTLHCCRSEGVRQFTVTVESLRAANRVIILAPPPANRPQRVTRDEQKGPEAN